MIWLNLSVQLWITYFTTSYNLVKTRYYFGALIFPTDVQLGHWWRLLTTCFIHDGWLPFSFTMIAFFFLSRLENGIGHIHIILIYLLSGVGSLALTFWIWSLFNLHPSAQMVFGSSACLMGLLGSWAFVSFQSWQQTRLNTARNRCAAMLLLFLIQVLYDSIFLKAGMGPLWFHVFGFALGASITTFSLEPLLAWNKAQARKVLTVTGIWFLLTLIVSGVSVYQKNHYPASTAQEAYDETFYKEVAGARSCELFLGYCFSADKGNALAQNWMGNYFAKRQEPILQASAAYWWKKAADQGNLDAKRHLVDFNSRHVNDATGIFMNKVATYKPKPYAPVRHVSHAIKLTPGEEAWAKRNPTKRHWLLF